MESGALDKTFGTGGIVTTAIIDGYGSDTATCLTVQKDGKVVVGGYSNSAGNYDFALVRYTASGALDSSFGTGGKVTTPISSLDDYAKSVVVHSDGKIVLAGDSRSGSDSDFALARYTASGELDTSFGTGGMVRTSLAGNSAYLRSMSLQGDGKIVVVGSYGGTDNDKFAVVRYRSNGSLDSSFRNGGIVTTPMGFTSGGCGVAVQSDGKIVVAGYSGASPICDFALVRYEGGSPGDSDSDGLLDSWELSYWPTIPEHKGTDDFDGDGVTELEELAFGLNPTVPDATGLPQPVNEGGYLTMTFTKHAGVTYEVQSAGTLVDGQPDSFSAASTTVLFEDASTLKVRDNFLIGTTPSRYMRVKVTGAP